MIIWHIYITGYSLSVEIKIKSNTWIQIVLENIVPFYCFHLKEANCLDCNITVLWSCCFLYHIVFQIYFFSTCLTFLMNYFSIFMAHILVKCLSLRLISHVNFQFQMELCFLQSLICWSVPPPTLTHFSPTGWNRKPNSTLHANIEALGFFS